MAYDIAVWISVLNAVIRLGGMLKSWWRRIRRGHRNIPATAVAVLPAGPLSWINGPAVKGKTTMWVLGPFYFTNASDRTVKVLRTHLRAYYRKWRLLPV